MRAVWIVPWVAGWAACGAPVSNAPFVHEALFQNALPSQVRIGSPSSVLLSPRADHNPLLTAAKIAAAEYQSVVDLPIDIGDRLREVPPDGETGSAAGCRVGVLGSDGRTRERPSYAADVVDEIAAFYDAHPYPPPVDDLDGEAEAWADGLRRRVEHTRLWPTLPYRDDHTILVAGCGTSQAAKYAIRYPSARVIGIDVSTTGVERTRALAGRHGLDHLEVELLPIEQVGEDRPLDAAGDPVQGEGEGGLRGGDEVHGHPELGEGGLA